MNPTLLLLGQSFSLAAKLAGFVFLAYVYWRYQRKPALFWSISWLSAAFSIISDITGNLYILTLSEAFWAAFLFHGVAVLLEEEEFSSKHLKIFSVAPVVIATYGIILGLLEYSSDWFVILGLPYASSALFMVLSGILMLSIRRTYNHRALYLGIILLINGIHEMDYPILRLVDWFAPIGFTLGAIFAITSAYIMIIFAFTEEFIKIEKPPREIPLKPRLMIIPPSEYPNIKEELKDIPVLAFVRDLDTPKTWRKFFVSAAVEHGSIFPTDLPKITEITIRYFREAREKNFEGVALIDCPEYLRTYNGFDAIVKFLASLKDYTILYQAVLILVIDERAWDERELTLLKRLLT